MAQLTDKDAMVASFQHTLKYIEPAIQAGRQTAFETKTIFLVGSGSGQHVMQMIKQWISRTSKHLECFSFFSGELPAAAHHPKMNDTALVLIVSKSGKTNTLEVANVLRTKAGRTIIFTQKSTNPIASASEEVFTVGDTSETLVALSILMYAVVGGLLSAKEGWLHVIQLEASLRALPMACAVGAAQNDDWARKEAETLKNLDHLYLVASGPHELNSHVWGPCIMTEWLNKHTHPIRAVEFAHGQHEIVRKMDMIAFIGIGADQEVMEDVVKFAEPRAKSMRVYDASELNMDGIDEMFRPMLAPFPMQAKMKRISAHLSVTLKRPAGDRNFEGYRIGL